MPKAVGIDLGTTNSVVAVVQGGEPEVLLNSEGSRLTPSIVAFTKTGERLVGDLAKRQAVLNPERTIRSIKRQMGTRERVTIDGKQYSPEEISAMILSKLKADAESRLGEKVTEAVITVPAYFDDSQRQATKTAGEVAGLNVLRIINEPTAAAIAYGLDRQGKEETIIVYDLGGGTFDVTVLEISEGLLEVKATAGDTRLGGDDFDERLMNFIADSFQREQGIDLRKDPQALQRLKEAAEKAKVELSSTTQTNVNLPFITADQNGPKHLNLDITRAKFQELTHDLLERTRQPFERALSDAGLKATDVNEVVLVGGSTRMPAVVELVKQITGKSPHMGINPDEAVAVGAAVQANTLANPGSAGTGMVLVDVTPLSLGVETAGGVFTKMIERNTAIPHKKTETFTTYSDFQPSVEIKVLQGERAMAADNKSLGVFTLAEIPPAPRGMPKIDVTFDIDANGIVNVTAREQTTGKEQKITITGTTGLNKSDVDRMVREAEANAAADAERREQVETKNQLDATVFQAQKFLTDNGEKVGASEKTQLESAIATAQEALKGDDQAAMKSAQETLTNAYHAAGTSAYQQAQPSGAPQGQPSGSDYAGYDNPAGNGAASPDGAVEGEVVEGEVTDKR
ncbi:MAG: molecular chaperone DnaK [Abitibacteriaceae bacterium]|nr:molecular chaperone DnaK [Abditibacteriaceae bacterium]MBV9868531.1 molecular chaperone DnaK [Abditibacteriaceae bacterium]